MYYLNTEELIYKHALPDKFWRWTEIINIYYLLLYVTYFCDIYLYPNMPQ